MQEELNLLQAAKHFPRFCLGLVSFSNILSHGFTDFLLSISGTFRIGESISKLLVIGVPSEFKSLLKR